MEFEHNYNTIALIMKKKIVYVIHIKKHNYMIVGHFDLAPIATSLECVFLSVVFIIQKILKLQFS